MRAYLITNLENGDRYVGITRRSLAKRWYQHGIAAKKGSLRMLSKAIRRFGESSFKIEEVATANDWQSLCEIEKRLIVEYDTYFEDGHGYNHTRGGDGGATFSGRKHTPETIQKMKAFSRKGQNLGHRHTPEAKARMSLAQKGHPSPPERNAKIAASLAGKPNGWLGRRHTEETKRKISEAKRKIK